MSSSFSTQRNKRPCLPRRNKTNNAYRVQELRAIARKRKLQGRSKWNTKAQLCVKLMHTHLPGSWLYQQITMHLPNALQRATKIWSKADSSDPILKLQGTTWLTTDIVSNYTELMTKFAQSKAGAKQSRTVPILFYDVLQFVRDREMSNTDLKAICLKRKQNGKAKRLPDLEKVRPKYIFIPLHNMYHYTLLVIDLIKKQIRYFDSLSSQSIPFKEKAITVAKAFHQRIHPTESSSEWITVKEITQHQGNGYDCGVHVCCIMRLLAEGKPTSTSMYLSAETQMFRAMMTLEIKRNRLIDLG